jgi:HAMP domain-containing protein
MLVGVKLMLLAATAALAIHDITALAIAFVVVGALIRLGGLG